MSIGDRITEALDHYSSGNIGAALISTCTALDATATLAYSERAVGKRWRRFVQDNLALITSMMFGRTIISKELKFQYSHPDITTDASGLCTFADIVYVAIRCGLIHDAKLPKTIEFVEDGRLSIDPNTRVVKLPSTLVLGLVFAVVCAKVNGTEKLTRPTTITLHGQCHPVDDFWGDLDKFIAYRDLVRRKSL